MSRFAFKRWLVPPLLMLVMLITAACQPHEYTGTLLEPGRPLDNFTLPTADGGTFRLSDYEGQMVLVYFGYTFCPDVCPATMLEARQAMEALGEDADEVQVVMVTVDPERDTLEQLQRYVTNFHPSFMGLRTTDLAALDEVLADFGATYQMEPAEDGEADYLVSHTSALFLIDREGNLREVFSYGTSGEQIAEDIEQLLKE